MLTARVVALRLGLQPSTVRKWLRDGRLSALKIGPRYFISQDDLAEFLAREGRRRRGLS